MVLIDYQCKVAQRTGRGTTAGVSVSRREAGVGGR
jgi:hypothetical protein